MSDRSAAAKKAWATRRGSSGRVAHAASRVALLEGKLADVRARKAAIGAQITASKARIAALRAKLNRKAQRSAPRPTQTVLGGYTLDQHGGIIRRFV